MYSSHFSVGDNRIQLRARLDSGAVSETAVQTTHYPAAAAEDALSPGQKRAVEEVVREYLRRNPEVLLEAIGAMRAKRDAEQQTKVQKNLVSLRGDLENDPTSPVGGNPLGNVTIVEFFDYQCPYCKRVFPSVQTLLKTDGNIRYVFKEFPILGPQSVVAARAALADVTRGIDTLLAGLDGRPPELEIAHGVMRDYQCAKWIVNQNAIRIVSRAMDVCGGGAFMGGHELSRLYRDVRAGPFMQPFAPNEARQYIGQVVLGELPTG